MHTNLDIDDEVLQSVQALARQSGVSTSAVVSRLLRQALDGRAGDLGEGEHPDDKGGGAERSRGADVPVDHQRIERIREREGF